MSRRIKTKLEKRNLRDWSKFAADVDTLRSHRPELVKRLQQAIDDQREYRDVRNKLAKKLAAEKEREAKEPASAAAAAPAPKKSGSATDLEDTDMLRQTMSIHVGIGVLSRPLPSCRCSGRLVPWPRAGEEQPADTAQHDVADPAGRAAEGYRRGAQLQNLQEPLTLSSPLPFPHPPTHPRLARPVPAF